MNNFENITKDLDTFKDFIQKHDLNINCDECRDSGLTCSDHCSENFIKYLELDVKEKEETDIDMSDWNKYIKKLDEIMIQISGTMAYTGVNYSVNHLKAWLEDGYKLTNNQKKLILEYESTYIQGMEHLERLKKVFEMVK